jgi:hypothetical protein
MDKTAFEIWSEGFAATGDSGEATLHGTATGQSFAEACLRLAKEQPAFAQHFDPDRMTYWGCRLFDNEADARKRFG